MNICGRDLCADLGGSSDYSVERTEGRRGEGFLFCVNLDEVSRKLRCLWEDIRKVGRFLFLRDVMFFWRHLCC